MHSLWAVGSWTYVPTAKKVSLSVSLGMGHREVRGADHHADEQRLHGHLNWLVASDVAGVRQDLLHVVNRHQDG